MRHVKNKKGAILIFVFAVLVVLVLIALAFSTMISDEIKTAHAGLLNMQVFYIAEAGRAKARWELTGGGEAAGYGESDISFGEGTYTFTTLDNGDGTYTITSDGYIPDDTNPIVKRRLTESNIPTSLDFTNLSLSATPSASSEQGQFTADKAIDGDSGTQWRSSVNNGSWLKLDYGSSTAFDRIVYTGSSINSYTIEYSGNDITWQAVTSPVESPAGTVNFGAVTARYLRFNVNGNKPRINELESYYIAGGATFSLGSGKFISLW